SISTTVEADTSSIRRIEHTEQYANFQAKSIDYLFPNRLIDDSYEEKDVLGELINRRESATELKWLLREKPRMGYQIEASINVRDSSILEDYLPPKETYLKSFTIPFHILNICFEKALADLRASVNVMSYSTFTNLGLEKLAPTKLIIELADRTVKRPKGIVENVLVGIDKFVFPVDFIVLDMLEDIKVPLILGRPFLSTAHAKIDVFKQKIALRIENDKIVFKSDNPTSNIIKRVYVSLDPEYGDYIDLNDLNERWELMRNQEVDDLGPTFEEGEVIDRPMIDIIKTWDDDEMIEGIDEYLSFCNFDRKIPIDCAYNLFFNSIMKDKIEYKRKNVVGAFINAPIFVGDFSIVTDFAVVENMDAYRDQDISEVIMGKPFCKASCVEARRFDGMITIYNGNDSGDIKWRDNIEGLKRTHLTSNVTRFGHY
ncbi:uncharacterized mitochondrial protein-like protein, partial [Tanacetum coccineum]